MKPYLVKTPKFVQRLFPKRIWTFPNNVNSVYLTFDDGPVPVVTPWVLATLKKYNAKATFFCIGDNVKKHPKILQQVIENGHSIGNHTYHHLDGWKTSTDKYIDNCNLLRDNILSFNKVKLFRPPYGKITLKQSKLLQNKGFKIIMWDLLSADFDLEISKEECLNNVLKNIQAGSIIVFHDSLKSNEKLRYVLPKVLDYLKNNEFKCESILI